MIEKAKGFTTGRLELSPITTGDAGFVQQLVNTEGWLSFIGDRQIHSQEAAVLYIRKIMDNPDYYYWVVRIKNEERATGIITFLKRDYLEHFDLGFAFLPEYEGRGFAFEAAACILAAVKADRESYPRVLATTLPGNVRSIGLLEKLGFKKEAEITENGDLLLLYAT